MSKYLLNHMAVHCLIALFSFLAAYFWLKSLPLAIFSAAVSVFLDADHLFDYLLANGLKFNPQKFFRETTTGAYFGRSGKVYVPLHSWELLVMVILLSIWIGRAPLGTAFAVGFVPHLLWDQITYARRPLMYSFIFRAFSKFDLKKVCGEVR